MKIGDLVRYRRWYQGTPRVGILVTKAAHGIFLVAWSKTDHEWEFVDEIEVINGRR